MQIKQTELDVTDARVMDLQQKLARQPSPCCPALATAVSNLESSKAVLSLRVGCRCRLAQTKESGDPKEVKKAARSLFKSTSKILGKKKKEAGPCMMCPIKQVPGPSCHCPVPLPYISLSPTGSDRRAGDRERGAARECPLPP